MADPITLGCLITACGEIYAAYKGLKAAQAFADWAGAHAKLNKAKQAYAALEASRCPKKMDKYPAPWKSDGTYDMRRKPVPAMKKAIVKLQAACDKKDKEALIDAIKDLA